jgi:transformation/transcription domain-associated protein
LPEPRSAATLNQLIGRQYKFLESVRDFKTIQFLSATSQLAHMDTALAEHTWLQFFPQVRMKYVYKERTLT